METAAANAEESRADQSRLMQEHHDLMQEMAKASPEQRTQLMEKMRENRAKTLATRQQHIAGTNAESSPPAFRAPPAPRIPEDATPELREMLTTRHALMTERMELMNQLRDAPPEERQQAMRKWHDENASRLMAMHKNTSRPSQPQTTPIPPEP